jgi:hypothetical protein
MSPLWLIWMIFLIMFLVTPIGYGRGYRGWGMPYPRYIQRRRASRAVASGLPRELVTQHALGHTGAPIQNPRQDAGAARRLQLGGALILSSDSHHDTQLDDKCIIRLRDRAPARQIPSPEMRRPRISCAHRW